MLTNERQRVRKGRQGFGIPSGLANRERVFIEHLMGKKGHQGKQPQQSGGGCAQGPDPTIGAAFPHPDACALRER